MRSNRELFLAALAMVLIGGIYLGVINMVGIPEASSLVGHGLGILGFVLMLATETLYSLRKRATSARWGRMSSWMQFHIFTGIVGPYLVFLHTAWKFQGLAGVVTLLTGIVVLSGFIGRYIYTAVPRTSDGVVIEAAQLNEALDRVEAELAAELGNTRSPSELLSWQEPGGFGLIFGRWLHELRESRRLERALSTSGLEADRVRAIRKLYTRRIEIARQTRSIQMARRMLAVWHSVHIPLGMALFAAAFVHIGAALYYATLQP
jgi:hypothetical protein